MSLTDHKRDFTYRGLKSAVKSFRNHYDGAKQQAVRDLLIPMDHYDDLAANSAAT